MSGNIFLQEVTDEIMVKTVIENKKIRIVDFFRMVLFACGQKYFLFRLNPNKNKIS